MPPCKEVQVVVDPGDEAFQTPRKQVGPRYSKEASRMGTELCHWPTWSARGGQTPAMAAHNLQEAQRLAQEKGWSVAPDGDVWRRVVASPLPLDIVERRAIQVLLQVRGSWIGCVCTSEHTLTAQSCRRWLQAGIIVICCGGGGIPVAVDGETGHKRGVEAVVDKDEASALLATLLNANFLLMLTGTGGRW